MGDDLTQKERNAVRAPMQWSDDINGGFSEAAPEALFRPAIIDGPFGYGQVNVQQQHDRDGSLLVHVQRLVRVRRSCPEIGWGACTVLDTGDTRVLALRYDWRGQIVVLLNNLSGADVPVILKVDGASRLQPLLSDDEERTSIDAEAKFILPGFGFRWLRGRTT